MRLEVLTLKKSNYHCLSCGVKVKKIVFIEINKHPKESTEISVGFHAFLCEVCFKRIFIAENWLRHWRMEIKERIIKRRD